MNTELNLLLLEDDLADAELLQTLLKRAGMKFSAVIASNEQQFLAALDNNGFDAVLADNALPQYSSMEALKLLRVTNPHVAFILVTGTVSEEFAVNIIQQGADDYILKTNLTRLPAAIKNAIEKKNIQREIENEKELSSSIINSLPGIFYLCNSNGKFLRCNKNFERISGYNAAEINKMTPEYFFSGDHRDHISRFIKKVFATGHSETEAIFTTRDMHKVPYYFTGMAVNLKNQISMICVGLDISVSKQSEKELTELNDELRSVSAHLEKIREEEQARIAREVHDQLGQQLTILKMDLSWMQKKINSGDIDTSGINDKMKDMKDMVDEAVRTVRKIASDLRPSILDDLGLIEALKWQSTEFSKRTGILVHFKNEEGELKSDPAVAIGLYRIYQEALTNVARHSDAKNVTSLFLISQAQLSLSITDDGIGFDMNTKNKTLGLLGMRERAYLIGGTVTISSEPGEGTTVMITVPFQQKENPVEE